MAPLQGPLQDRETERAIVRVAWPDCSRMSHACRGVLLCEYRQSDVLVSSQASVRAATRKTDLDHS